MLSSDVAVNWLRLRHKGFLSEDLMSAAKKQESTCQPAMVFKCRKANAQLSAVFLSWTSHCQQQRRIEHIAAQRSHAIRQGLLAAVLSAWHQQAAGSQKQQAVIARCQKRHAANLMQQSLQSFKLVVAVKTARRQAVQQTRCKAQVSLSAVCLCIKLLSPAPVIIIIIITCMLISLKDLTRCVQRQ